MSSKVGELETKSWEGSCAQFQFQILG